MSDANTFKGKLTAVATIGSILIVIMSIGTSVVNTGRNSGVFEEKVVALEADVKSLNGEVVSLRGKVVQLRTEMTIIDKEIERLRGHKNDRALHSGSR